MPSYSPDLRITLIDSGTQAGTWGDTTNATWQYVVDPAISGFQSVSVTSANQALTYINGSSSTASLNQAIYASLAFTTTTAAPFNVYAPPNSKQYILWNNSAYAMTIYNSTIIGNTTAAGIGVSIAAGKKVQVFSDGTNFYSLNINEIFAPYGVLYADATGAVTSSPGLLGYIASSYVFDSASTDNAQAYVRAINTTSGTSAGGAVLAQAEKAIGAMRAFSSTNSTFGANQTLIYGYGSGASGTILGDFSSGAGSTNRLRFMVGTTSAPITAGTINSSGNWDFNGKQLTAGNLAVTDTTVSTNGMYLSYADTLTFSTASGQVAKFTPSNASQGGSFYIDDATNTGVNSMRYAAVYNRNTGSSAYATVRALSYNGVGAVAGFPSTFSIAALAGKAAFFGSASGAPASGTVLADFSDATNQLQFMVGTAGSPLTAGTINSSGNWDFNGKQLTAGNLSVTSGTAPVAGMYLQTTDTLGFSTASTLRGVMRDDAIDWGTSATTLNGNRFIRSSNLDTGTGARSTLFAQADKATAAVVAWGSGVPTYGGRTYIYGFGTGANGTYIADYSTGTNQMVFQVGTSASPTTAATVNSSGIWTYPNKPAFFTYLSTTQTNVLGTTATTYTVPFDVELFDRTNNVSAGVFTAPVTGIYRFSMQTVINDLQSTLSAGAAATAILGRLVTTSQTYAFGYLTPGGPTGGTNYFGNFVTLSGSVAVSMTAGDTAYITLQAANGVSDAADVRGNTSGGYYTWFSGELVA